MKSIYNNNKGLEYMVKDIKELKTISSILELFGIKNEILGKSTELEEELLNLIKPLKVFIDIFNDRGWIVSISMNNDVIKNS